MDFTVTVALSAPCRVAVAGDVDASSAHFLENLLALASRSGSPDLVLDLARVPFIDCAGLGALLRARRRIASRGGALHVHQMSDSVQRVVALTKAHCLVS